MEASSRSRGPNGGFPGDGGPSSGQRRRQRQAGPARGDSGSFAWGRGGGGPGQDGGGFVRPRPLVAQRRRPGSASRRLLRLRPGAALTGARRRRLLPGAAPTWGATAAASARGGPNNGRGSGGSGQGRDGTAGARQHSRGGDRQRRDGGRAAARLVRGGVVGPASDGGVVVHRSR